VVDQSEKQKGLSLPSLGDELLLKDAVLIEAVTEKARRGAPNDYAKTGLPQTFGYNANDFFFRAGRSVSL
jgi:hypothetical protein